MALLAQAIGVPSGARHFDVIAVFEPAKKPGGEGAIAVTFRALDPDVKVNETPAPRLKLDLAQTVLEDRQPEAPPSVPDFDPATVHYLDINRPVRFPAAISRTAAGGQHEVKATLVYFYCSTREAWCRRGSVDLLVPVTVR
jgi:hypothetical protein